MSITFLVVFPFFLSQLRGPNHQLLPSLSPATKMNVYLFISLLSAERTPYLLFSFLLIRVAVHDTLFSRKRRVEGLFFNQTFQRVMYTGDQVPPTFPENARCSCLYITLFFLIRCWKVKKQEGVRIRIIRWRGDDEVRRRVSNIDLWVWRSPPS